MQLVEHIRGILSSHKDDKDQEQLRDLHRKQMNGMNDLSGAAKACGDLISIYEEEDV